jgi:hypothetical protein
MDDNTDINSHKNLVPQHSSVFQIFIICLSPTDAKLHVNKTINALFCICSSKLFFAYDISGWKTKE